MTGVNNLEAFALGTTFGVGFEYTVGAGALISTGCPFNEYNGILMFVRAYAIFHNLLLANHAFLLLPVSFDLLY